MIGDFEPLGHNTEHLNIYPPLQKNPSGQFEGKENERFTYHTIWASFTIS